MTNQTKICLVGAGLALILAACAEPESDATTRAAPVVSEASDATDIFGSAGGNQPLPAEEVFFPDVFPETDGSITVGFRMLPGYYIYRDKIGVRSLSDGVEIGAPDLPAGEIIVDEWFGEQQVYYNDMMANASVNRKSSGTTTVDVEVSWQGCKEEELCYRPVSKVIAVELAANVESAAD